MRRLALCCLLAACGRPTTAVTTQPPPPAVSRVHGEWTGRADSIAVRLHGKEGVTTGSVLIGRDSLAFGGGLVLRDSTVTVFLPSPSSPPPDTYFLLSGILTSDSTIVATLTGQRVRYHDQTQTADTLIVGPLAITLRR